MKITLTPQIEAWIRRKVASGRFKSGPDVVRAGLRLLAERDAWRESTRRKILVGVRQARAGRVVDGEKALDAIVRNLRRRHR